MDSKKLRVEIKRPYPEVICGRFLDFPESLRNKGKFASSDGYSVSSVSEPAIEINALYCPGNINGHDEKTMLPRMTADEIDAWLAAMRPLVREINEKLRAESPVKYDRNVEILE